MNNPIYCISPASDAHYRGLHRATDVVAHERKYLAITQAPPWEQSLAFYRSLHALDFPHFVATDNDEVVGWCDVAPLFGETRAHIGTLGIALLPSARHVGLGTRLLQAAIDKSWARGLTRIELTVRADNEDARRLYQRFGFESEGWRRHGARIDDRYYDVEAMALLR